jgi:hypothetical protein
VPILLGTINTTTGYVGIDGNPTQVIFVDGQNGWIWDTSINGTLEMITDPGFPPNPIDVTMLDGFFVVISGGTNNFNLSEFNNGLIWSEGTEVFTANFATNLISIPETLSFQTGVPVEVFNTGGALPAPLMENVTYYVINVSPGTIKLADSLQNAFLGMAIILADNGSGTNTITNNGQLQQGQITSHPGTLVACRTLHRRLFLFSQYYYEVWENQGIGSNLPFRRNNNLLGEVGTPSVGSVSTGFDLLFFLSQDKDGLGPVMMISGSQSMPISTPELDAALQVIAAQVGDARGVVIRERGLLWFRLNFTMANHTYVYNVTQSSPDRKKWHEEETLRGDRHPAQTHVYFNGVNYYGDYQTNILYIVSPTTYTNNGENIHRYRICKPFGDDTYHRLRLDRLQVDMQQGAVEEIDQVITELDLVTENGVNIVTNLGQNILVSQGMITGGTIKIPILFLSISKDGGVSYGYAIDMPMGNLGQRTARSVARRLGTIPRGQYLTTRFDFYNAVPFNIFGSALDYEVLPE